MSNYISEQIREQILEAIDIVALISEYVNLVRAGQNFKARCPFHSEKTPSFFVSPHKQIFKCFGCGVAGNAITFLMQIEGISYREALEILAQRAGIEIPKFHQIDKKKEKIIEDLYSLNKEAALFFRKAFQISKNSLQKFLESRSISLNQAFDFGIGYAPASFTQLYDYFNKKGVKLDLLLEAHLVRKSERGKVYDFFRNRLIFPIQDLRGRFVGFGGRLILDEPNQPKYLNTPETPIFQKRNLLYGLNLSKDYIRKTGEVIIVEGYMDFFRLWISGIKNCVASMGTSLTKNQVKKLERYAQKFLFSYDSDSAGKKATIRAVEDVLSYNPQLTYKIVELPSGEDPDSFIIKYGVDKYREALKKAQDFLFFKLKYLKEIYPLDTPQGKMKIILQLGESILKLDNSILQTEYIKEISANLKVREEDFRDVLSRLKRKEKVEISKFSPKKVSAYQKSIDNLIFFVINDKVKNWQEIFPYLPEGAKDFLLEIERIKEERGISSLGELFGVIGERGQKVLSRIAELEFEYENLGLAKIEQIIEDSFHKIKETYYKVQKSKLKAELDRAIEEGAPPKEVAELQRKYMEILKFEKKLKFK